MNTVIEKQIDIKTILNDNNNVICVPINTQLRSNGDAICGAGVARLVRDYCNYRLDYDLEHYLGIAIQHDKEDVYSLNRILCHFACNAHIYPFVTKKNWAEKSTIPLIVDSAQKFVDFIRRNRLYCKGKERNIQRTFYLPRPGCYNGGLDWESQVKPAIWDILLDKSEEEPIANIIVCYL